MRLTWTNIENKGSFQRKQKKMHILSKRGHVLLDFCVFLKKKITFLLIFKRGSI